MNLFYIPDIPDDQTASLSPEESRHCIKVLRMKAGETVHFTDGKGYLYRGSIVEDSPKRCLLQIMEKRFIPFGKPSLHLAIAPTKNLNRTEWFLEKATEIGVARITPLYCTHSERRTIKPERLEKVLISAMKQSLKTSLPELMPAMTFNNFVKSATEQHRFFAYCGEGEKKLLQKVCPQGEAVLIMIGPEGGFAPQEVATAQEHGFIPVSLGASRLRTETAGIVACHTFNLLNENQQYTLQS
ncbi:MAG: 16S rRNA (uracil(1498)-N(3))-methyltransferase [Bacteroidetes bacterium]|nr:MAG: 16S rRNA (uracil(1498)-N(3))-methyltransferase [Bacteroidota bacterium]